MAPPALLSFALALSLGGDPTFEEGVRLYKESSYEQAIFRFEEIAVRPDIAGADKSTALLWLGLSYAGTGDLDAAGRSFRYAFIADATAPLPTETSPAIVEMVESIRRQVVAASTATRPAPVAEQPPAAPQATTPGLAVIGGGVSAAVGALAVIGGGVLALVAADRLATANDPDAFQDDANAAREGANATATAAAVLVPIGAVLGIAGGVLLALNLE